MTVALIALAVAIAAGAIAFAVRTQQLSSARQALDNANASVALLKTQVTGLQNDFATAQATLAKETAARDSQIADLQKQLQSAENALVQVKDPTALGDYARDVLSRPAGASSTGPANAPSVPPGSTASRA